MNYIMSGGSVSELGDGTPAGCVNRWGFCEFSLQVTWHRSCHEKRPDMALFWTIFGGTISIEWWILDGK
jgi:hypothetical protein